jgi:heme oxygenase (mycobilin-producing)
VVTRFIVPDDGPAPEEFAAGLLRLSEAFSPRPGHRRTRSAQALDDPTRWVLVSEWDDVGPWRRALSSYDVRIEAMPLMAYAEGEPGVYETPTGRFDR